MIREIFVCTKAVLPRWVCGLVAAGSMYAMFLSDESPSILPKLIVPTWMLLAPMIREIFVCTKAVLPRWACGLVTAPWPAQ